MNLIKNYEIDDCWKLIAYWYFWRFAFFKLYEVLILLLTFLKHLFCSILIFLTKNYLNMYR